MGEAYRARGCAGNVTEGGDPVEKPVDQLSMACKSRGDFVEVVWKSRMFHVEHMAVCLGMFHVEHIAVFVICLGNCSTWNILRILSG